MTALMAKAAKLAPKDVHRKICCILNRDKICYAGHQKSLILKTGSESNLIAKWRDVYLSEEKRTKKRGSLQVVPLTGVFDDLMKLTSPWMKSPALFRTRMTTSWPYGLNVRGYYERKEPQCPPPGKFSCTPPADPPCPPRPPCLPSPCLRTPKLECPPKEEKCPEPLRCCPCPPVEVDCSASTSGCPRQEPVLPQNQPCPCPCPPKADPCPPPRRTSKICPRPKKEPSCPPPAPTCPPPDPPCPPKKKPICAPKKKVSPCPEKKKPICPPPKPDPVCPAPCPPPKKESSCPPPITPPTKCPPS